MAYPATISYSVAFATLIYPVTIFYTAAIIYSAAAAAPQMLPRSDVCPIATRTTAFLRTAHLPSLSQDLLLLVNNYLVV
jgi:hypothetical protein